ncbi:unnamed protein product [Paramecium sonneborni]|uniref:Protein kinase domain-containing protein n=1 Tax=Paramecium sonneborni TaxID=65129 RepID=A0A8S1QRJ5_9CILI|nr:unnamed protein product [Paramecium sonneborni]
MDNIIQKGNYIINLQDVVAQGVRGTILKCKERNRDEQLCVKIISKTPNYVNLENENKVLKKLRQQEEKHPNVLRIYDITEDDKNYFVFTELCDMNLQKLFEQQQKSEWFTIEQIQDYIGQIVRGYQYIRSLKIILRDLSPKSILVKKLSNNRILLKIADFGISRITEDGYAESRTGIPLFAAPEIYLKSENQQRYNDSCDIYSLGIILYIMCYKGQKPYKINNFDDLKQFHEKLKLNGFQCPNNAYCPQDIRNLIEKMIIHNSEARLSWDQLDRNFTQKFIILQDIYFVDLSKPFGSGAQGITYDAFNLQTQEQLVCKTIQNKYYGSSREIQIFEQSKGKFHDNVIKVFQIIKQTEYTYLIMEKCDMNLQTYFQQRVQSQNCLQTREIIEILYQIVEGYCFLKKLGIIHRDLKPENIVLKLNQNNEYIVKIIDFGVGKIIGKDVTATEAGTPKYSAPEVLLSGKPYDYQCDIFSLGVILHYLAFQRFPKVINSRSDLIEYVRTLEYQPFVSSNHENPLIPELINKMLAFDPAKRITWDQLQVHQIFDNVKSKQPKQNQIQIQIQNQIQNQNPPKLLQEQFLQTKQIPQQPIPQGNSEIYLYIASIQTFAFRIFTQFDEFQKENLTMYDEIFLLKQFILRFSILCLMAIQQLQINNFIILDGVEYKINQLNTFQNWSKEFNLNQLKAQNKDKFDNLKTAQITNKTDIIVQGEYFLMQLSNQVQQNQNFNFLQSHKYFNMFYQQIRVGFLNSNLPIKNKFFLEKFSIIFLEYPIKNYSIFQEQKLDQKINQKIFIQEQMEIFIDNQLKKN